MLQFVGQPVLWSVVFVVSLFVLVRASRSFTRGAEALGLYLGIPPFIVGVTIVAVGTSFPELMSSVYAVMVGHSEIVVGNVLGSNITNVFLVLGVSVILAKKISTRYNLIRVDLPLFVASAFFLVLLRRAFFASARALSRSTCLAVSTAVPPSPSENHSRIVAASPAETVDM